MPHRWKWLFAFAVVLLALAGSLPASAQDLLLSYFVPQGGPLAAPCEGSVGGCPGVPASGNLPAYSSTISGGAVGLVRRCPDLDSPAQELRNWARLKIVVLDAGGVPMAGIPAAMICAVFNGGTTGQGFAGMGADSIQADPMWSGGAAGGCPVIRCVQADAPTDVTGTAYITWIGHAAVDPPGVGNRDPLRKWGGYDSNIPVFVMGVGPLLGRLTTMGVPGSYNAIVRNYDSVGYLGIANSTERVTFADYNPLAAAMAPGAAYNYKLDYDGNGTVGIADYNLFIVHLGTSAAATHRCNFPNPG